MERLHRLNWWLVQMRWLACLASLILITTTVYVLRYLEEGAAVPLLLLVVCLAGANVAFMVCLRRGWAVKWLSEIQVAVDLMILTAMLHFSGGIENPLWLAYLFHVIIGGILLSRRKCFATVLVAWLLFSALAMAEMAGLWITTRCWYSRTRATNTASSMPRTSRSTP